MTTNEPKGNEGLRPVDTFKMFEQPEYHDDAGNIWKVTVRGREDVVNVFLDKGRFRLSAHEISKEDWQQRAEKWRATTHDQDKQPTQTNEAPSFDLHAVLLKRAFEGKYYVVTYNVDVPTAGHSVHTHTLYAGDDGTALCRYQAQGRAILVILGAIYSQEGLIGEVSAPSGIYATWQVVVVKDEGTSYTLTGDAIVPPFG